MLLGEEAASILVDDVQDITKSILTLTFSLANFFFVVVFPLISLFCRGDKMTQSVNFLHKRMI